VARASATISPVSSLGIRGIVNQRTVLLRDLHNGLLKLALHLPPN